MVTINPSPTRKFGYSFGTGITIFIFILDFLVILTTVSNCIVYNKIASGEPNNDISQGWARFLLAVNIIIAICAFVIFFWILYIFFTGKRSIGNELVRKQQMGLGNYLGEIGEEVGSKTRGGFGGYGSSPHLEERGTNGITTDMIRGYLKKVAPSGNIQTSNGDLLAYNDILNSSGCSDGSKYLACPTNSVDPSDSIYNQIYYQFRNDIRS